MAIHVKSGTWNTNVQVPMGSLVCLHTRMDEVIWMVAVEAPDPESCIGCCITEMLGRGRDNMCPRTIECNNRTHPCVLADCCGIFEETDANEMEDI